MSGLLSTLHMAGQGPVKSRGATQAQDLLYQNTLTPAVRSVDINDGTSFSAAMVALMRNGSDGFGSSDFSLDGTHAAQDAHSADAADKHSDFSVFESTNPAVREFGILMQPPSKDFEILKSSPLNVEGFKSLGRLSDQLALAGKFANAIYAA